MKANERVLEAASELFFRHGVKSITMDDIAKHLGMSKKTIYEQYDDKDHIVTELTVSELEAQCMEMEKVRKASDNAIEEILNSMSCISRLFTRINPSMLYDLHKFYPKAWGKFREFKERTVRGYIEDNLKRGIKEELYRKNLKIKVLARLRMEQVEMGFNPALFPSNEFNVMEVQLEILDHFMHGITTLKGHKLINKYKQIKEDE